MAPTPSRSPIANSLTLGLSSALGSLVPLIMIGVLRADAQELVLFAGIITFLIGVWLCGQALPIAEVEVKMGYSRFSATNCIWLLMLGAGSVPNIAYCLFLMRRNKSAGLMSSGALFRSWVLSIAMGLLWAGSIFLYGAATPRLGDIGPSIGWPLSLAVSLVVANLMGVWLGEWRGVSVPAARKMKRGLCTLLVATAIYVVAARLAA